MDSSGFRRCFSSGVGAMRFPSPVYEVHRQYYACLLRPSCTYGFLIFQRPYGPRQQARLLGAAGMSQEHMYITCMYIILYNCIMA